MLRTTTQMPRREQGAASMTTKTSGEVRLKKQNTSLPLWKRVGELAASSAFLLYLADVGSDRLSLTQVSFFMLAATADAAGKPATRSEIIQTHEESFKGSIRNSYRQLLEPARLYPQALGWLTTETNPMDSREQILRLTEKGKAVVEGALVALDPIHNVGGSGSLQ
jgi:hypothetical protein